VYIVFAAAPVTPRYARPGQIYSRSISRQRAATVTSKIVVDFSESTATDRADRVARPSRR